MHTVLDCPVCQSPALHVKHEATYVYTYDIPDSLSELDNIKPLPYTFNNREQINMFKYVECKNCLSKFNISNVDDKVHLSIIQKAVRSDNVSNPEFLG